MNYEEKRELRLQISQLLADAGLNQGEIKKIVEEELRNKINRAIDQTIKHLNAQSSSGDYIGETIKNRLNNMYVNNKFLQDAIFKAFIEKYDISINLNEK